MYGTGVHSGAPGRSDAAYGSDSVHRTLVDLVVYCGAADNSGAAVHWAGVAV